MLLASLSIGVFVLVIILIVLQPRISWQGGKRHVSMDYSIAPLLGVGILLLTFQVDPSVLLAGIVGTATIRPYMIIVLFFSLAYICISIDMTGFFEFLALRTAKRAGSSGTKLFSSFFLLSSVLTVFTSNDIVILTLTPIILYFCKYTKSNPFPYLIGQFFAANIWSVALYVGNPTNIIVAQAYNLTFSEYSAWMLFPTVAAGLACYGLLRLAFRVDLSRSIVPPDIKPESALKDRPGAVFGLVVLGACLVTLALAPVFHLDMGLICLSFACVMVGKDVAFEARVRARPPHSHVPVLDNIVDCPGNGKPCSIWHSVRIAAGRMPWKIMPFVFGMFIMVEILSAAGWIGWLAAGLATIQSWLGAIGGTISMVFLSSMACNAMNNQPMTILFTRAIQDGAFAGIVSPGVATASMYGLIMGSNFGANFTLIGALAGIMWSSISRSNGTAISYKEFAKEGFKIMPVVVLVACAVLALEIGIVLA
ncbi:MAG: hypothetical protein GYA24_08850 [Candidatus Lokiarchaeota archaeon]|nr:hypothetical protein [Candidatus Lokiarchaeota archaeon]